MKNTKKGFTLVELLVVIAILAILATVSVVGYTSYISKANESLAQQELSQIRTAVLAEDIVNDSFDLTDMGDPAHTENETTKCPVCALQEFVDGVEKSSKAIVTVSTTGVVYEVGDIYYTWTFSTNKIAATTSGS